MKSISYRLLANSALFCSSLALTLVNADNLCASFFDGTPIYISEINSSGNDDHVVFKLLAILGFFFTTLLSCFKNKKLYALVLFFYLILAMMISWWTESNHFSDLVYLSIRYCQNYYLFAFVIGQTLFLILSGLFLFKSQEMIENA